MSVKKEKEIACTLVLSIESEKTTGEKFVANQQAESLKRRLKYAQRKLMVVSCDESLTETEKSFIESVRNMVASALSKLRNGVALTEGEERLADKVYGKELDLPEMSAEELEKFEKWARRKKVKVRPPLSRQQVDDLRERKDPIIVLRQEVKCAELETLSLRRGELLPDDIRVQILLDKFRSQVAERFEAEMLEAADKFRDEVYSEVYEEVYGDETERLIEFWLKFLPVYQGTKKARGIDKANKELPPEQRKTVIKTLCLELADELGPELFNELVTELVTAKKGDRFGKNAQALARKYAAKRLGWNYHEKHIDKLLAKSKKISEQVIKALEASEQAKQLIHVYKEVIA